MPTFAMHSTIEAPELSMQLRRVCQSLAFCCGLVGFAVGGTFSCIIFGAGGCGGWFGSGGILFAVG